MSSTFLAVEKTEAFLTAKNVEQQNSPFPA